MPQPRKNNMANSQSPAQANAGSGQMLTFRLGAETYGVDILRVKEIRGRSPVTKIPHAPPQVLGVLNLRGAVVPIIDLRLRFALPSAEFSPTTVIIVLSLKTQAGQRECGVVVDSVSDVADVAQESVKAPPSLRTGGGGEFISGIATTDEQMLILLDVDELVGADLGATTTMQASAA
jgi:purine-binding chemotaxis protein CheW